MKKITTTFFYSSIIIVSILIGACASNSEETNNTELVKDYSFTIIGKWKMIQTKTDGSSDLVLNFEEAGFFEENTILNDPKFAAAGIDKIQPIAKGQWELENDQLIIIKYVGQDSVKNEKFTVIFSDSSKMKLKNKKNKTISFKKYSDK